MKQVLIFTHKVTPRLRYSFEVLLEVYLGLQVELTTDANEYSHYVGPKLSYTHKEQGSGLHFASTGILFEKGVSEQNPKIGNYKGVATLFKSTDTSAALPFDPFAAAFFMLTRYEECLPHLRDKYDRFEAEQSLAYQQGFIHQPVVDHWALMVGGALKQKWPELQFKKREFKYISTIDIDNAYAYRLKGLFRTAGALARALTSGNFNEVSERLKVIFGNARDPYDTYDLQLALQERYGIEVIYFFLLADYGLNDKNVPHYNTEFRSLIKHLADYGKVGIHPGFGSNRNKDRLKVEKKRLENIVHSKVKRSRQHFLILHMPHTYRRLIENEICEDHTMGFAACTGFRAGTCTPYPFYDLDLEQKTKLMVHPFTVMDATLKYYMKLEPEQAKKHVEELMANVRAVNGTFISLWHNETLNNRGLWSGWQDVYEHVIKCSIKPDDQNNPN